MGGVGPGACAGFLVGGPVALWRVELGLSFWWARPRQGVCLFRGGCGQTVCWWVDLHSTLLAVWPERSQYWACRLLGGVKSWHQNGSLQEEGFREDYSLRLPPPVSLPPMRAGCPHLPRETHQTCRSVWSRLLQTPTLPESQCM